ncbi:DUF1405 domain-containing protein [Paenalkalicoccus suaedae]|uniref:DUF1405 domain-containing protein n=1 Tax=Paenalkalicoccus suaedae TaxID=2592382 RepID=A0A859FE07_9BACI|nr:DUF1405 domain-containing protein [Paenalkalicoccus suaedae]QKS71110.1 DUF1405 domain-containing protein [Paenalkalicoccus suaedae]
MGEFILYILRQRIFLLVLFIVNFLGTIYGYYWYENQLMATPPQFLLFVPDSPTASLFITIAIGFFLFGKRWPFIEAFAAVTLIKYGLWAVAMNLGAQATGTPLSLVSWMLILSHAGMALQAFLYMPYFRIKPIHLVLVAIWTLFNDFIDYYFDMHPWVARSLEPFMTEIAVFTVSLSIFSLLSVYLLNKYLPKVDLR